MKRTFILIIILIATVVLMTSVYLGSIALPVNTDEPPSDTGEGSQEPELPVIEVGQVLSIPDQPIEIDRAKTIYQASLSNDKKQVALTFDAGWIFEPTNDILAALEIYEVTATFFLRGGWVEKNPELVTAIDQGGHLFGNHSYSHGHMKEMSSQEMQQEIEKTTRLIEELTGSRPSLFRPPYGEYNTDLLEVLASEGYTHNIMWTVDTLDWKELGIEFIVNRATSNLEDGSIILMHVGSTQTPKALPAIIETFKNNGFEFVTVDELIEIGPGLGTILHEVRRGDTLAGLSDKYNIPVQKIIEANNLP